MAIVNFEVVASAAEALQAAGQRASVRAVTAAIGGGSPNTILKLLQEWKAGRPVVRIADTELDQKITSAIAEQMQRVATAAAAAAEERAAGVDEDLQAMSEAHAAAEKQIDALTAKRDAAQAQAADLVNALKEAQAAAERDQKAQAAEVAALRSDLAAERQRQEAAAAALARAEVRLEVVPGLQAEVERLRAALDTESTARVAAEQQAAVLAAKLEAMTDRATKAEFRADATEKQIQQGALDNAAREIAAAQEAAKQARADAKKAGEEAAELRESKKHS